MSVEDEFDKIAEEAGRRAASVKCSKREYVEGLDTIIEHLALMRDCAQGEIEREES